MVTVSVRELVEFILREGNIDSGMGFARDTAAMQEGIRIHKKLQKQGGPYYQAEVPMVYTSELIYEGSSVSVKIEGRADGIIENEDRVIIHEIKSMYRDVRKIEESENIHLAQAKCYAAMYLKKHDIEKIIIKISYCQIETMFMKEFEYEMSREDIFDWFDSLLMEYAKWLVWQERWIEERNNKIKTMQFPYEYRKGQFEIVKGVYLTILRNKNLFLQAPTGVGKTLSTVFPAVTGLAEGIADKIFYLTAKTITRTVAEDTFNLLISKGIKLKVVTVTAKDKICIFDKPECNPEVCERAKGHFDRVNDALYDMLVNEENITRTIIEEYASRYKVCPFEMSLDLTLWSDVVICDYNYVFDPRVYLKRFFAEGNKKDYIFLVDEAHNLIDRARTMYTAVINKHRLLEVKKQIEQYDPRLAKTLNSLNRTLLSYKRECDDFLLIDDVSNMVFQMMRSLTLFEDFMRESLPKLVGKADVDSIRQLYFDIRFFTAIYEIADEKYKIYANYNDKGEFEITLACMDPSGNIKERLKKGRSAVFFSATLLPVKYYISQLGGSEEDYAIYAESSFDPKQQLIMIANDVSVRYSRRNRQEYCKIADYIVKFVSIKKGNYIVFFPSYKMLEDVYDCICEKYAGSDLHFLLQQKNMNETDKEEFLREFENIPGENEAGKVGMCVMGGIFGEGIDLRNDMLIGACIVGTGLPMIAKERQLYKEYFDENNVDGFNYAYLYPGMNKVLQAAGRVIRTAEDKGAILLLDDRFTGAAYNALFPREWKERKIVNINTITDEMKGFWS